MPGLKNTEIVAALERRRVGAARQAHAAAHLVERLVLVLVGPALESADDLAEVRRPALQERRYDLHAAGTSHDRLHGIDGLVHAANSPARMKINAMGIRRMSEPPSCILDVTSLFGWVRRPGHTGFR